MKSKKINLKNNHTKNIITKKREKKKKKNTIIHGVIGVGKVIFLYPLVFVTL